MFPSLKDAVPPKLLNYGEHQIRPLFQTTLLSVDGVANVCSKCLTNFITPGALQKHTTECSVPYRPIYEEESFKITRLDILREKQMISILSQMFIKSKTVYFEVENYDFFILYDQEIFGYFSRYKEGDNSLNCFFVFPCFQGQGVGTLLLDFSTIPAIKLPFILGNGSPGRDMLNIIYKPKSPEKPYTKKAIMCFRKYWKYKVIGAKTVSEIAKRRNLTVDEAIVGLELHGFNFKKWKLEGKITVEKPRMLSNQVFKISR